MQMQIEEIVVGPAQEAPPNALSLQAGPMEAGPGDSLAYRQLFRYAEDMRRLARERAWALAELQVARRETLFRLAVMAGYNAPLGPVSMLRIGVLSALIAHVLGMPEDYSDHLCIAAPLRDIGMMAVRASGQGNGTASPGQGGVAMENHPVIGAAILGGSFAPELQMAEEVALSHHERFDGRGYPAGLSGSDIPLSARIVAVAEKFDALRAEGLSVGKAVAQLRQLAGGAFDHRVVEAMAQCAAHHKAIERVLAAHGGMEASLGYTDLLPDLWRAVRNS